MVRRGARCLAVLIAIGGGAIANPAKAGAWNMPAGEGAAIMKYEPATADRQFNAKGNVRDLSRDHNEQVGSLWVEYGVSDRVTGLLKVQWQDVSTAHHSFSGWGPAEVGVRVQAYRGERTVASVQASYGDGGKARSVYWAEVSQGKNEAEIRLLLGRSVSVVYPAFVEAQVAYRWMEGIPDEVRTEATAGVHVAPRWTVIGQVYTGKTQGNRRLSDVQWTKLEGGLIHRQGDWSAQVGWRHTVDGRNFPRASGPIVALWRRF